MRYTKGLLLILLSIVITSCNLNEYKKLQLDKNKYYFSFDQEVPNSFQLKIKEVFGNKPLANEILNFLNNNSHRSIVHPGSNNS